MFFITSSITIIPGTSLSTLRLKLIRTVNTFDPNNSVTECLKKQSYGRKYGIEY
jgi:hypothetical protein